MYIICVCHWDFFTIDLLYSTLTFVLSLGLEFVDCIINLTFFLNYSLINNL